MARQDDEILTHDCDILVLCAVMRTLSCCTAEKVKAKIILEAAHAAITPSAHQTLISHHKLVLPDILTVCGHSLASYYEYLRNTRTKIRTGNVFQDLLFNVEKEGQMKLAGQSNNIPFSTPSSIHESKMVFDAIEAIIRQTSRVRIFSICVISFIISSF